MKCESANLNPLKTLVGDVGIAQDGDVCRVMMLDSSGNEIDDDIMKAVIAIDMKERGCLADNTIVSTVMSNLCIAKCMQVYGINVMQTKVGDCYVLECMRENVYSIGGEHSGHMIMLDHKSTGDGLVTTYQFLAAVKRISKTVDEAVVVMTRFPQELINV